MSTILKSNLHIQGHETWISKSEWGQSQIDQFMEIDLNLSRHFKILSMFLVQQVEISFFWFQRSGYTTEKVIFNISLAINMASQHSYWKFLFFGGFLFFFFHSKMPKTPKMLMKKDGYWWMILGNLKSNTFLSLKCRGILMILSNICNKRFGKIVNSVQRDKDVRDQNNGGAYLNSHV